MSVEDSFPFEKTTYNINFLKEDGKLFSLKVPYDYDLENCRSIKTLLYVGRTTGLKKIRGKNRYELVGGSVLGSTGVRVKLVSDEERTLAIICKTLDFGTWKAFIDYDYINKQDNISYIKDKYEITKEEFIKLALEEINAKKLRKEV